MPSIVYVICVAVVAFGVLSRLSGFTWSAPFFHKWYWGLLMDLITFAATVIVAYLFANWAVVRIL